jgi:hypothetical protein
MKAATRKQPRKTQSRAKLAKEYGPDTEGAELPEVAPKLSDKKQTAKDGAFLRKFFQGTVPASKVFVRKMDGFSSKQGNQCLARTWLLFNEPEQVVTVANTYHENLLPNASYDPATYTYPYKAKVHDPKMEAMEKVDVTEWPSWITNAAGAKRRGRRSSK